MRGAAWREVNDMATTWVLHWDDVAEDLDVDAPGSAGAAVLTQWDPQWICSVDGRPVECDVWLPEPASLPDFLKKCLPGPLLALTRFERETVEEDLKLRPQLPEPSQRVRQFLCNAQCPRLCCTLYCPWNSMRNDGHGLAPGDIVEIFGRPCSCKSTTCRKCVQEELLQKHRDPLPYSLVSEPLATLETPPPAGHTVYTGVGEPVSDASEASCSPMLYSLTRVPWKISQAGGRLPDWLARPSFQQLSLPEFLHFNGFNTQSNYRLRDVRSYRQHMQPIHDQYTVGPVPVKVYGHARKYWTPGEARNWPTMQSNGETDSEDPLPASRSTGASEQGSGWEWR